MAGVKRTPKLRYDGRYYVANFYKPDGKRSMVSFGPRGEHTEGEIYATFGKWLDLYEQQAHKVLSFKSPYDAVKELINPTNSYTIHELLGKYRAYAQRSTKPVSSNGEHPDFVFIDRVSQFLQPYNDWPIGDFGPDELFAVQQALPDHRYTQGSKQKRYTRRGVNDTINWLRRIWKWGMGRSLVTAEQLQSLEEVKSLRIGTTEAHDNPKRNRVTEEEFDRVLEHLGGVVTDMLTLIWHTGMRPNEVCIMRPYDILRDDRTCWLYIPGRDSSPVGKHKTMRFDRVRVIPLTKECQEILNRRIKDFDSKSYVFSPAETVQEMIARKTEQRKTPLAQGNRPGTNRKEQPMIKPGEKYDHNTLRRACQRACRRASIEPFTPYDLRRSMATRTRSVLGKEAAKVLLGHTETTTTDIYLLDEVQEAVKVAKSLASSA